MVEILCPHCDEEIGLDDDAIGEFICPHCGEDFTCAYLTRRLRSSFTFRHDLRGLRRGQMVISPDCQCHVVNALSHH